MRHQSQMIGCITDLRHEVATQHPADVSVLAVERQQVAQQLEARQVQQTRHLRNKAAQERERRLTSML